MSKDTSGSNPPGRGGWKRKLAWIAGIFLALLVAAYFVVTSGGFVKSVILPKIGAAMNADITAADVELSPFSQLVLRDVKVTPKGTEPLLTASLVRARYSLLAIIRGNIAVEEVTVESPTVTLVENADGTSNLDPLAKNKKKEEARPPAKSSAPPKLDIKSIALNNATIRRTRNHKEGACEVIELSNANIKITGIRNGSPGTLELSTNLGLDRTTPPASLQTTIFGRFTFDLTADLKPTAVKGQATLSVGRATGDFADLNSLAAALECDATSTEVKQIAIRFTQSGQALGELRASGPFDAAKSEGKLSVAILSLDRRVLNLAGAASGIDFGTTVVNSTNTIELTKGGSVITASGQLDAARVRITRQGQTTPTLDLTCDYGVTVDNTAQSALLQTLHLTGTQDARPLLRGELTSPMTIAFGGTSSAVGDAALDLVLTGLNLADWKAFTGGAATAGLANAKLKLLSQQAGKQLTYELDGTVDKYSAAFGSNQLSQVDVRLKARGSATDLKQFKLDEYRIELAQAGQTALTVSGNGTFDSATADAAITVTAQAVLARLLALLPQPGVSVTAGTLAFDVNIGSKEEKNSVKGQFTLADFTGGFGDYRFTDFGTAMDFDVATQGKKFQIRKAAGSLREGGKPGGNFDLSGEFDSAQKTRRLALKLVDFNQNGLRPFLESALGDKKLISVSVNSAASANFDANGDAAIKGDLQLANLVVSDPKGEFPSTPLQLKALVDAAGAKSVAQIRQCQLTFTPTDRAKNELNLTGTVDYSRTNATAGHLKLVAESLDVTRFYNLFADKPRPAGAKPADAPRGRLAPDKEPEAVLLPFHDFTFEAAIGRFCLRELDLADLKTTAKVDGGRVLLKPCAFTLNGAPVKADADLDLGVPGYRYDVTLDAQTVPLEPLVNSFQRERKGELHGQLTAGGHIKGAGVTGASLQKNLDGNISVVMTNLSLPIANVRTPVINAIVNSVAAIPDLLRNPVATVGHWLGNLTGISDKKSGWAGELMAKPIDVIAVSGDARDGLFKIDQAEVRSAAFRAQATGDIMLDSVLTNSAIQIPVVISLGRPYADKIGWVSALTPTNLLYIPLPQFLTLKGTLGKPDPRTDKVALTAIAARTSAGVVREIGGAGVGAVSGILGAVGNLLTGEKASPPDAGASPSSSTNKPAATNTNAPPATTNAPASNAPPQRP